MVIAFRREELVNGETHLLEHIAGVFGIWATFFCRHTEIVDRHQHLYVANQLNDGKDSERYQDHLFGIVVHETTAEALAYAYRDA